MLMDEHNLPYPYNAIVDGNWISAPQTFNFPIPVAQPETATHLQLIAAALCTMFQNQAQSGFISCFAYNLFSNNRYNNEFWLAIVADAYDLGTKIQKLNPNADPHQVLSAAVTKYHPYAAARCIEHFPDLVKLVPQQMAAAAIQAVNNFRTMVQTLDVQVERLEQAQNQSGLNGLFDLNSPNNNNNSLPQQTDSLMGVSAFATVIGHASEADGWGGRRRPPEGAKPAEVEQVVERQQIQGRSIDPQEDFGLRQARVGALDIGGNFQEVAPQTLTGRRRPAAIQDDDVDVSDVGIDELTQIRSEPVSLADMPQEIQEMFPEAIRESVGSDSVLKARETPREEPVSQAKDQITRRAVVPRALINLPETEDDAINATSAAMQYTPGLEADGDVLVELTQVGDAFGTYLSDEGHLAQVVSAEDNLWAPSFQQPMRCIYDPLKWHRLLLQRTNVDGELIGSVIEGFMLREEEDPVDYLDLEIDPVKRAKALEAMNRDNKYIPLNGEYLEVEPVNRLFLPIGLHHSAEKKDEEGAKKTQELTSKGKSVTLHFDVARRQRKEATIACVELYNAATSGVPNIRAATLEAGVIIRGRTYAKDLGVRANVVPQGRPTHALRNQVVELMKVQPAMAKRLDALLAQDVNNVLHFSFGYEKQEIDSFVGDYADLTDHLLERYDDATVDVFESAVDDKLARWSISDDGKEIAIDGDVLCVMVNCPIEKAGIHLLTSDLAALQLSQWPNLERVIDDALARKTTDLKSPEIWFIGLDGEVWQAHKSAFDGSVSILVRR